MNLTDLLQKIMSLSWKLIRASANKNDSNQNEIQDKNQKQDFIESFDQVRWYIIG